MNLTLLQIGPAQTLGWTLIHFLWQGAVIAAMVMLTLAVLARSSARARYLVACGGLGTLLLCPLVTFRILLAPLDSADNRLAAAVPARTSAVGSPPGQAEPELVIRMAAKQHPTIAGFAEWLDPRLPWVLLGWSAGVLILSTRLAVGWWRVRRMAGHGLPLEEAAWQERLCRAGERLGVTRPVRLVRSALVQVPTALGWLRPVVLLPMTSLTGLAPAELEALLAHELAHVSRQDYLINLLQSIVETLLFYHPAVWWISGQIRIEREHACDDLVVAAYADRITYARALANLEERRCAVCQQFALSASGGSLVRRIRRLFGQPVENQTSPGWIIGMAVPVGFACLLLAVRNAPAAGTIPPSNPGVRDFRSQGFEPSAPAPQQGEPKEPEKALLSDFQTGLLLMRGTAEEPDRADHAIQAVSTAPPQVTIEINFTELGQREIDEVGLRPLVVGSTADLNSPAVAIQITNRTGLVTQPDHDEKGNLVGLIFDNPGLRNVEQVSPGTACTIRAERFHTIIQALKRRARADLLAAPRITTLSGRQARIEVIELKNVVTGVSISTDSHNKTTVRYKPFPLPTGPAVDVFPEVSADGKMIRLRVIPSWTEFLGYDDPGPFVPQGVFDGDKLSAPLEVQRPLPRFHAVQTMADVTARDGETIVLSGFGSLQSQAKGSESGKLSTRQLVVFVSPVIVDPAGNRVHPE